MVCMLFLHLYFIISGLIWRADYYLPSGAGCQCCGCSAAVDQPPALPNPAAESPAGAVAAWGQLPARPAAGCSQSLLVCHFCSHPIHSHWFFVKYTACHTALYFFFHDPLHLLWVSLRRSSLLHQRRPFLLPSPLPKHAFSDVLVPGIVQEVPKPQLASPG